MKIKLITLFSLILLSTSLFAKGKGGIYMNVTDYKNNALTLQADRGEKFKIHLHDFFGNTSSFTVNNDGAKHTMQKNDVYGYRDCNNNTYRFYANDVYKIVEAGSIYIYSHERNVAQTKGFIVVNDYFFSTSPDGPIVSLTIKNLINAYSDNEIFIERLDILDGDVTAYDSRHKMLRVNYLYSVSKK
jgi:hypothetical protein